MLRTHPSALLALLNRGVARSRVNPAYLRGDAGVGWVMLLSSAALRAHLQAQMSARAVNKFRVAPARARVGKARRPPFRPQLNEPNRQLSMTSRRSAGCLASALCGWSFFGTEGGPQAYWCPRPKPGSCAPRVSVT